MRTNLSKRIWHFCTWVNCRSLNCSVGTNLQCLISASHFTNLSTPDNFEKQFLNNQIFVLKLGMHQYCLSNFSISYKDKSIIFDKVVETTRQIVWKNLNSQVYMGMRAAWKTSTLGEIGCFLYRSSTHIHYRIYFSSKWVNVSINNRLLI